MAFALVASGAGSLADVAGAEGCPNERIHLQEPYAAALPDCRAYEQVSPVDKNGSDVFGEYQDVIVAPSGEALSFTSLSPFPVNEGSEVLTYQYVSMRGPGGWSTQGLAPPSEPAASPQTVFGVTPDLSYSLLNTHSEPPLAPGGVEGEDDIYLHDNRTGSYRVFMKEPYGEPVPIDTAESGSRIFYETLVAPGTSDLYEWREGKASLLDILPGGEEPPSGGGAAGWLGQLRPLTGVFSIFVDGLHQHNFYTQGAISQNGARVYFTDLGTEHLYLREPRADLPRTVAVSQGPAQWRAATPDGSRAFYTEKGALWRFDAQGEHSEALTGEAANVQGVLGIGGEGEYVYFAATSALASGAKPGAGNIYLWHDGAISLVTSRGEGEDWAAGGVVSESSDIREPLAAAEGARTAQVSADGRTLVFVSKKSVTGYDNTGPECLDATAEGLEHKAGACDEIYLYSAANHTTVCVSCNTSGAPPEAARCCSPETR